MGGYRCLHRWYVFNAAIYQSIGLVLGISSSVQPVLASGNDDDGLYRLLKGGSLTAANNINNGVNGVHRANLSSATVDSLFQGMFVIGALVLIVTANKVSTYRR